MLSLQHKELSWIFGGLVLMALAFGFILAWKKTTMKRIGDPKLVKTLIGNYSSRLFSLKFILLFIAFALGTIAVLNPRKPGAGDSVNRKGIDVAIALDVSKSMLATDLAPNRLERAKQFIGKLMNDMPDDRIALVLFAGKAYLQMPLTTDHGAAQLFVSSATPDAVPQQGTVVSNALSMSANAFNQTDKRFKTIILISDGEDHDEDAVKTAKDLAAQGIMINTVGIGSAEGSTIIDPATGENKRDETGNVVVSKLNEDMLQQIATATNGSYTRLQGSDEAVLSIRKQLSHIERKAYADVSQMNFTTYYMWFAAAMLLFLLIESFIPERRKAVA